MKIFLISLTSMLLFTSCSAYRDRLDKESVEQMRRDSEVRQTRLKAEGSLNQKEYETISDRMGWSRTDARGLPPPPTTEELEKKVKVANP